MVKRYFPDLKPVGTGIAAVMSEDDGKFPAAWVQGSDYDALAAELARCRTANVYDGAAHKRVADLEAALRQLHHNARHALGGNAVRDRKIIEDALVGSSGKEPRGKKLNPRQHVKQETTMANELEITKEPKKCLSSVSLVILLPSPKKPSSSAKSTLESPLPSAKPQTSSSPST